MMRRLVDWTRRHPLAALVVAVSAAVAVLATVLLWSQPWADGRLEAEILRLQGLDADGLANEKLRQEILQLQAANQTAASPWGSLLTLVPVITAALGGAAVLATIWKQMTDRADQLRQDREERERELERRAGEAFKSTTENLAAPSAALRASAAATLSTFLRPEYSTYRNELLLVSIAKSKEGLEDDPVVIRLMTRAVELALRATLPTLAPEDRRYYLDLTRCQLKRIDLSDLDLSRADIAFADLREARLRGTNLFRAQGRDIKLENARLGASERGPADLREARFRGAIAPSAQFHKARCVSIRLEDAHLQGAEFFDAQLQEAHFDGADLQGAKFHGADLNNAYFRGATMDDAALRSIATGAAHWREAHFDPEHRSRLEALSQGAASERPTVVSPAGAPELVAPTSAETETAIDSAPAASSDEGLPPTSPLAPEDTPVPGTAPA